MEHAIARTGFGGLHGAQRGWFIHATVYLSVNVMLAALALLHGRSPLVAPALGWGIGLAIHGLVAFVLAQRPRRW